MIANEFIAALVYYVHKFMREQVISVAAWNSSGESSRDRLIMTSLLFLTGKSTALLSAVHYKVSVLVDVRVDCTMLMQ